MKGKWPSKALVDVCQIRPSKSEVRRHISDADLVSFVPMEDLGIGQKALTLTKVRTLAEVVGSYTYFADGDVLLAKITPCFENGKLGIAEGLHNGVGFGSSEYVVFRPGSLIDKEWLYYFLSREEFRREGAKRMSGAVGHKRVSKEFIEAQLIPIPPLAEQRRIITLLEEALAGIDTAVTNAEKNIVNTQELYESILSNTLSNESEPSVEKSLGEVCELFQGLAINKGTKHLLVVDSDLPLLRIKDLREGTHEQYIAPTGFPKNAETFPDDLIYTRTGQVGLVFRGRRGIIHNNCFKIVPKTEIDRGFLYWWLQEPKFRQRIIRLASKAAQPDITHTLFKAEKIRIPSLQYQKAAASKLEEIYVYRGQMITNYENKIMKLSNIKRAILDKAFAGELLSGVDTAAQEAVK